MLSGLLRKNLDNLGSGQYATVYAADNYAIKLQCLSTSPDSDLMDIEVFQREIEISDKASRYEFGPRVFEAGVLSYSPNLSLPTDLYIDGDTTHVGYIISDQWDAGLGYTDSADTVGLDWWSEKYCRAQKIPVTRTVQRNAEFLQRKLTERVLRMWRAGVVHGDLTLENVLVRFTYTEATSELIITDVTLTDFGRSFYRTDEMDIVDMAAYYYDLWISKPQHLFALWRTLGLNISDPHLGQESNLSARIEKTQHASHTLDLPLMLMLTRLTGTNIDSSLLTY